MRYDNNKKLSGCTWMGVINKDSNVCCDSDEVGWGFMAYTILRGASVCVCVRACKCFACPYVYVCECTHTLCAHTHAHQIQSPNPNRISPNLHTRHNPSDLHIVD